MTKKSHHASLFVVVIAPRNIALRFALRPPCNARQLAVMQQPVSQDPAASARNLCQHFTRAILAGCSKPIGLRVHGAIHWRNIVPIRRPERGRRGESNAHARAMRAWASGWMVLSRVWLLAMRVPTSICAPVVFKPVHSIGAFAGDYYLWCAGQSDFWSRC